MSETRPTRSTSPINYAEVLHRLTRPPRQANHAMIRRPQADARPLPATRAVSLAVHLHRAPAATLTSVRTTTTVASLPQRLRDLLGLNPSGGKQRTSWWVLRNRRFRLYFYGSVVSDLGTWLQNTAQVLLAYRLAH